jgi:hypothetical protein
MTDPELTAIAASYDALKGLDRKGWTRALEYIVTRLAGDDRRVFITSDGGLPEPVQWVIAGQLDTASASPEDAVLDTSEESWTPIEVNGVAVVSQRFAVVAPNEETHGNIEWFDTRDEAEAFVRDSFAAATDLEPEAPL